MTLGEALAAAAADLGGTHATEPDPGMTEWSVRGIVFAAMSGPGTVEFRLEPIVARAALGTPDTAGSRRGAEWIAFSPVELDRFALDRAIAWLGSAHRHAK